MKSTTYIHVDFRDSTISRFTNQAIHSTTPWRQMISVTFITTTSCDGVSNHQPHDCLLNRLLGNRSKKISKLRITGLCAGNSPETGEFPAQIASNAENVSIWWRHHVYLFFSAISEGHIVISQWQLVNDYHKAEFIKSIFVRALTRCSVKRYRTAIRLADRQTHFRYIDELDRHTWYQSTVSDLSFKLPSLAEMVEAPKDRTIRRHYKIIKNSSL